VLVYGNINIDITLYVEELPRPGLETLASRILRSGGGSAANTAVALSRLGVPASILGCVGTDTGGREALKDLEIEGVDTTHVKRADAPTGRVYVIVDARGERTMIAFRGANNLMSPDTIDADAVTRALWVHVSGGKRDVGLEILELASKAGIPTSYDPGRAAYGAPKYEIAPLLERTDVLLVNELELNALRSRSLPLPGIVVVKLGARGSKILVNSDVISAPAFNVRVIDTTGAGDAFNAGFIAGLSYGLSLNETLIFANAVAAMKVAKEGARSSPALKEVIAFLQRSGHRDLARRILSIGVP